LSELAAFLHEQAETGDLNVLRFSGAGPANQGLDLYVIGETSLHPATIDPRDHRAEEQIENAAAMRRTVLVLNGPLEPEQQRAAGQALQGAERLWTYTRPGAESSLDVWEIPRSRAPQ
jgi:hypothetical protein